jgi:hypothetical protein
MMIRTLQQRMVVLILVPVGAILIVLGGTGFFYARDIMLAQWRESALLKLQRAAHHIDMRLGRPLGLLGLLSDTAGVDEARAVQDWIVEDLQALEGVARVRLDWDAEPSRAAVPMGRGMGRGMGRMMGFHRANIARVTNPVYNPEPRDRRADRGPGHPV